MSRGTMAGDKILCAFFERTQKDLVLGPGHIALYVAILNCWIEQKQENPVVVFGYSLRKLAKISGRGTYHKLLGDLINRGYIQYKASHDARKGSEIIVQ